MLEYVVCAHRYPVFHSWVAMCSTAATAAAAAGDDVFVLLNCCGLGLGEVFGCVSPNYGCKR